jgi:hypothetical protein
MVTCSVIIASQTAWSAAHAASTVSFPPPTPNFQLSTADSSRLTPLFAALTNPAQIAENTATLSLLFATLTRSVSSNSFICNSYTKSPGYGHLPECSSRAAVFSSGQPPCTLAALSCTVLPFFAQNKNISHFISTPCALFAQKHRGWAPSVGIQPGGNKHGNLILGRDCRIS